MGIIFGHKNSLWSCCLNNIYISVNSSFNMKKKAWTSLKMQISFHVEVEVEN